MKTLNVMLSNLGGRVVPIGYEGENLYTRIRINCIEVFSEYPDATVSMVVSPPVGEMYPAVVEKSGVMVIWDITDSVLSSNGSGECQLTFTEGDVVRKSVVFGISINRSLVASGEAPEPVQEWIDRAEQTAQEIAENAAMLAKQDIVESYGEIAPAIIETASGAIASFSDGADGMLVKTLNVDIDPVQDLHGYDSPWPAGGGKNKLPLMTDYSLSDNGVSCKVSRGTITLSGTASAQARFVLNLDSTVNLSPSTNKIAFCNSFGSNNCTVYFARGNTNVHYWGLGAINRVVSGWADTGNENIDNIIVVVESGGQVSGTISPMLVSLSETDLNFAPYSNSCPITGWESANVTGTGINVWDEQCELGILNSDGSARTSNNRLLTGYISVVPGETYYLTGEVGRGRGAYYDKDKNFLSYYADFPNSDYTFTVPSNAKYLRYCLTVAYGATYNHDVSFNYPSTDNNYHAYSGSTAEYAFPQAAKPVYGGTLTIHQDGSGELVVDKAIASVLKSGFGSKISGTAMDYHDSTGEFSATDSGTSWATARQQQISNVCKIANANTESGYGNYVGIMFTLGGMPTIAKMRISDYLYQTLGENDTVDICYKLATPVTYQLTNQQVIALLKGRNNVWADTGDVAVEYPADTKLYIDGKVAELQALILENISNS